MWIKGNEIELSKLNFKSLFLVKLNMEDEKSYYDKTKNQ